MNSKYKHLLEPEKIRNVVLKNHLEASKFAPQYSTYEYDKELYCKIARNGAAIVTIGPGFYPGRELEHLPNGMPTRFPSKVDLTKEDIREKYRKMISAIQECGSIVTVSMMEIEPIYMGISSFNGYEEIMAKGEYFPTMNFRKREATTEELEKMTDEFAWRAKDAKDMGANMVTFYMCYRSSMLAQSLSPVLNKRTDKFGGATMKERATLTLELFKKVRKLCGEDFLIEMQMSAEEDQPGYNSDDFVEYCKIVQDYVDIVQIRSTGSSYEHANGFNFHKGDVPPMLKFAEKLKKSGCTIKTAPVTGFGDPDEIENYIKEGKTDLVVMARRFLSDSNYIEKIQNGNTDDIIPCLRCNECHGPRPSCAVNPQVADWTEYKTPDRKKKVAVIGGGIAGLAAALICERRGHEVTLYEKTTRLGGQLKAAAEASFKWPIKDYLNFLIQKVNTSTISVQMEIEATRELLEKQGFDAIICALGSKSKTIPVKGADAEFVWMAEAVYGNEEQLGHKVVVIGGADTGRETALHLAQHGHEVVMITRGQAKLWHDFHVMKEEEKTFKEQKNLSYIDHAQVMEINRHNLRVQVKTGIPDLIQGFPAIGVMGVGFVPTPDLPESLPAANGYMMFKDGKLVPRPYDESNMVCKEETIEFDDVVVSGGREPLNETADCLKEISPEYYVIGDNIKPGDIKACNASAYKVAMNI